MDWIEIKIVTTEEASDAISDMLTSIGAEGVIMEDPNEIRRQIESADSLDYADDEFLSSLGTDVTVRAYFSSDKNMQQLEGLIKEKLEFTSQFLDVGKGYNGYKFVDDQDWSTAWKKYYKPFNITENIIIKPSWEDYKTLNNEIVIEIDPGMAFGTGSHETTQLCSQLLENYLRKDSTVLDLGCGTGILSIIAAKLGASAVTAVDIDEIAVRVANENCQINGVDSTVTCQKGIINDVEKRKYDVVVANIIADVIIDISSSLKSYLKDEGVFITSGIIRERKDDVLDAYSKAGFVLQETLELGEWVAMVFSKDNN
jgi:ribosomal protein L11 methyltransferase